MAIIPDAWLRTLTLRTWLAVTDAWLGTLTPRTWLAIPDAWLGTLTLRTWLASDGASEVSDMAEERTPSLKITAKNYVQ